MTDKKTFKLGFAPGARNGEQKGRMLPDKYNPLKKIFGKWYRGIDFRANDILNDRGQARLEGGLMFTARPILQFLYGIDSVKQRRRRSSRKRRNTSSRKRRRTRNRRRLRSSRG